MSSTSNRASDDGKNEPVAKGSGTSLVPVKSNLPVSPEPSDSKELALLNAATELVANELAADGQPALPQPQQAERLAITQQSRELATPEQLANQAKGQELATQEQLSRQEQGCELVVSGHEFDADVPPHDQSTAISQSSQQHLIDSESKQAINQQAVKNQAVGQQAVHQQAVEEQVVQQQVVQQQIIQQQIIQQNIIVEQVIDEREYDGEYDDDSEYDDAYFEDYDYDRSGSAEPARGESPSALQARERERGASEEIPSLHSSANHPLPAKPSEAGHTLAPNAPDSTSNSEAYVELEEDVPVAASTQAPQRDALERAYKRAGMTTCPKCEVASKWGEASWCPLCGYYPELDEIVQNNPALQHQEAVETVREMTPEERYRWILIAFGGVGLVLLFSMAVRVYFYYNDGPRGQWTIVQVLLGLGCFAAGQIMATLYSMSKSTDVTLVDSVLQPLSVWKTTMSELPFGAFRIYTAVWGLSAAVSAALCIGGVTSEMIFGNRHVVYKGKQIDLQKMVEENAKVKPQNEVIESISPPETQPESTIDIKSPMMCQVYGFMRDGSETSVSRLLCCGLVNGELQHVAVVRPRNLKPAAKRKLRLYLNNNLRSEPLVDTRYNATWVDPVISAQIKFDGWSPKDIMIDPQIVRLTRPPRTVSAQPAGAPGASTDAVEPTPEN